MSQYKACAHCGESWERAEIAGLTEGAMHRSVRLRTGKWSERKHRVATARDAEALFRQFGCGAFGLAHAWPISEATPTLVDGSWHLDAEALEVLATYRYRLPQGVAA